MWKQQRQAGEQKPLHSQQPRHSMVDQKIFMLDVPAKHFPRFHPRWPVFVIQQFGGNLVNRLHGRMVNQYNPPAKWALLD